MRGPGIRRVKRGKGFSYYGPDGAPVDDKTRARIEALVIPPAWKNVWISPHQNGHIQAVGTDAAGRRQYWYHQQWQRERAEEKFERVLRMAKLLPDWRAQVLKDLDADGLGRDKVLAIAQYLVDHGYFRSGGEEYAQENNSFGLATLRKDHVRVGPTCVEFDYPAKSGVQRTISLADPLMVKAVGELRRADTACDRLLCYRTDDGGWAEVHADEINARFHEILGPEYSVKDMRTWHGTVLAATAFAVAPPPTSKTAIKRANAAVMKAVSGELGNTPAVARSSYVDPRVVRGYENGLTIARTLQRADQMRNEDKRQDALERATVRLIRRVDKLK